MEKTKEILIGGERYTMTKVPVRVALEMVQYQQSFERKMLMADPSAWKCQAWIIDRLPITKQVVMQADGSGATVPVEEPLDWDDLDLAQASNVYAEAIDFQLEGFTGGKPGGKPGDKKATGAGKAGASQSRTR